MTRSTASPGQGNYARIDLGKLTAFSAGRYKDNEVSMAVDTLERYGLLEWPDNQSKQEKRECLGR